MTPKQQKFCDYYMQSGNATEAAKKAGYSEKTAYSMGFENLKKPEIQEYLSNHSREPRNSRIAGANEVLEFLSATMRNADLAAKDRTRAAELLGKRYALFDGNNAAEDDNKIHIDVVIKDLSDGGSEE